MRTWLVVTRLWTKVSKSWGLKASRAATWAPGLVSLVSMMSRTISSPRVRRRKPSASIAGRCWEMWISPVGAGMISSLLWVGDVVRGGGLCELAGCRSGREGGGVEPSASDGLGGGAVEGLDVGLDIDDRGAVGDVDAGESDGGA